MKSLHYSDFFFGLLHFLHGKVHFIVFCFIFVQYLIVLNMSISKIKALILFVLNQIPEGIGKHELFKILYFANQKHLVKWGDAFISDFVAMKYGPVPSSLCDLLNKRSEVSDIIEFDEETNYILHAKCPPDMDELSQTEVDCLSESIKEYGGLPFGRLTSLSHDRAWEKAWNTSVGKRGAVMDIVEIAKAAGADENTIACIVNELELQEALG
jgi:uncharacterized phage-associated protein